MVAALDKTTFMIKQGAFPCSTTRKIIEFNNVNYSKQIERPLLSAHQLQEQGYKRQIKKEIATIEKGKDKFVFCGANKKVSTFFIVKRKMIENL